jgi:hypothetical protein
MNILFHDLRLSFRQLRKARTFSYTVVLILALGIGATTAIFSLVEGVLLRPLPFSDPDHLVLLGDHIGGGPTFSVTARESRPIQPQRVPFPRWVPTSVQRMRFREGQSRKPYKPLGLQQECFRH